MSHCTLPSATVGSSTSLSPHIRGFALTFLAVATAPCTPLCTTLHAAVVQQRYANGGRITNRVCSSMFAVLQVHGAGSCQRDSWGNYMAECNASRKTYYRLWGVFFVVLVFLKQHCLWCRLEPKAGPEMQKVERENEKSVIYPVLCLSWINPHEVIPSAQLYQIQEGCRETEDTAFCEFS